MATMKETANVKSVRRIEAATREFIARCDEITDFAKNPEHRLSERFSPACILRFNETGIEFIEAIAESESVRDLIAARKTFKLARERVMCANRAIISRLGTDHHVVDGVMCCEETFFDLLARADPTVRVLTGLAKSHRTVIRIALTAAMTNVRKQLERIERKDEVTVRGFALPALQQIVDAVKGRPEKAWAMSFMRSLYGSGNPNSGPAGRSSTLSAPAKTSPAPTMTSARASSPSCENGRERKKAAISESGTPSPRS